MAIAEFEPKTTIIETFPTEEVSQINGIVNPENVDPETMGQITAAKVIKRLKQVLTPEEWEYRASMMRTKRVIQREIYRANNTANKLPFESEK